ncbi:MAG TPA: hypothetical protein VJ935_05555 [Acidimicrobiia bacterium]|nr:hypothetical protein [Acidimicrobiia bacterium]
MSSAEGYLRRGLRQIGPALHVDLVVEFDRRVNQHQFRSRTSMVIEACVFCSIAHANWDAGDHPHRDTLKKRPAYLKGHGYELSDLRQDKPRINYSDRD